MHIGILYTYSVNLQWHELIKLLQNSRLTCRDTHEKYIDFDREVGLASLKGKLRRILCLKILWLQCGKHRVQLDVTKTWRACSQHVMKAKADAQLCVAVYSGVSIVWLIITKPGSKDLPSVFI